MRNNKLEATFSVTRAAGKLSQSAKIIEKNALDLRSTLARPPIYNRAYLEKLATASSGTPVGVTKLSLL